LHDLGKIGVADEILKKGRISLTEVVVMKMHPHRRDHLAGISHFAWCCRLSAIITSISTQRISRWPEGRNSVARSGAAVVDV
jgi:hypothetical protein